MNKSFLKLVRCIRLQMIGVPSASGFYWGKKDKQLYAMKDIFTGVTGFERIYAPAYTDADLMDFLPGKINNYNKHNTGDSFNLIISKAYKGDSYTAEYMNSSFSKSLLQVVAITEVDVKFEMINKLISKKLLKL